MEARAYIQTHDSGLLLSEELCRQLKISLGHVVSFFTHENELYLLLGNDLPNARTLKSGGVHGYAYVEDVLATLFLSTKYGELFGPLRFELPKLPHEEGDIRSYRFILMQEPVTP